MAQVTFLQCDVCGVVGGEPGYVRGFSLGVNGLDGHADLCGACAGKALQVFFSHLDEANSKTWQEYIRIGLPEPGSLNAA